MFVFSLHLIVFVLIAKCHKPSLYRLQLSVYFSFQNLKTAWNENFQMCFSTIKRKCCMLQSTWQTPNVEGCLGLKTRNSYWSHKLYQYWIPTLCWKKSVFWLNHMIWYMKVPAFHPIDNVYHRNQHLEQIKQVTSVCGNFFTGALKYSSMITVYWTKISFQSNLYWRWYVLSWLTRGKC